MSSRRITRSAAIENLALTNGKSPPLHPATIKPPSKTPKSSKRVAPKPSEGTTEQFLHGPHKLPPIDRPSTPPAKRARLSHPPPETPTPSLIGLITSGPKLNNKDEAPPSRPAEPHITNAPLQTPGGSHLTAYTGRGASASPSKSGIPRPTTTTRSLLQEACAHLLQVEPRLQPVIAKHHCRIFAPEGLAEVVDPFRALASSIMGQQVSGAAAASIKKKFIELFPLEGVPEAEQGRAFPTPAQVAACELGFLRQAGLSGRKAEYIKGLAEKFASGELTAKMLVEGSYEEVLEKLIAVRGLGRWSVEMFACFGLKRMDVFSTGDLGVQRGMAALVGKDVKKLKAKGGKWKYMSEAEMLAQSEKFAPYRSLFMWYMWRIEDVNVDAIQDN
ncbi:3-methyladenine DNA glycosylase [Lambiella insularis]|nr:3-methyladenine DNA glycosylase [Lambiella insularis]